MRTLLKDDGLFVFEEPYLPAMINRCSFDQIYDEHVFLFSATSVERAFRRHGLYLFNCEEQWAHGGSMRYWLSPKSKPITLRLQNRWDLERSLQKPEKYQRLKTEIEIKRDKLRETIADIRRNDGRIVGYGATSKSTTVAVYCGLGPNDIEYISDTTPIKQGKFSPGAHIPVKPHEEFKSSPPDVALLFAWNHRDEIQAKEKDFRGKWLNYVPGVSLT